MERLLVESFHVFPLTPVMSVYGGRSLCQEGRGRPSLKLMRHQIFFYRVSLHPKVVVGTSSRRPWICTVYYEYESSIFICIQRKSLCMINTIIIEVSPFGEGFDYSFM